MWKAIKHILIFFGIQIVIILPMLLLGRIVHTDRYLLMAICMIIYSVLICLYVIRYGGIQLSKETFTMKSWAILLPYLFVPFLFATLIVLEDSVPVKLPNLISRNFIKFAASAPGLIAIGIFGPIGEEFLFRGAVLNSLLEWEKIKGKPWRAILLSAALFSLAHINPAQLPIAFTLGLLLGWLRCKTRSLMPGILIHCLNNSLICIVTILIVKQAGDEAINASETTSLPSASGYLVAGIALILLAASIYFIIRTVNKHYPLPVPEPQTSATPEPLPEPLPDISLPEDRSDTE